MTFILGISGSLRPDGATNKALAVALQGAQGIGARTQQIDLNDFPLPFYDGSTNATSEKLRDLLKEADGVILATPEYHGGYSGVLKNALDWTSQEYFRDKPVGLVGVSAGSMGALGALQALREVGRSLHAWVIPQQAAVVTSHLAFDEDHQARDPELQHRLQEIGRQVARFVAPGNSRLG